MVSKKELAWARRVDENGGLLYAITSSFDRSWYYLYDKNLQKIAKAKSPDELERKYNDTRGK